MMKLTVLLVLTSLFLAAITSLPVEGRLVGKDLLLSAIANAEGPWNPSRCIARNNDPGQLKWESAGMHLWDCNGSAEDQRTRWSYTPESGYEVELGDRNDLADLCFDVPEGNIARGRPVRLYKCNGTAAQQFQPSVVYQHIDNYPYFFLMMNTNRKLCLTAYPGADFNGRFLYLEYCDIWSFRSMWLFRGTDGKYYRPSFPRMATPEVNNVDKRPPGQSPQMGVGPMQLVPVPVGQGPPVVPVARSNATGA